MSFPRKRRTVSGDMHWQRPGRGPCFCRRLRAKLAAMSLRIATFNVENLMNRFDFSGFRNQLNQDRSLALFAIKDEAEYRLLEQARAICPHRRHAPADRACDRRDPRRHICACRRSTISRRLKAFEYGYLFKMVGEGYRNKYTSTGNDSRGIDVAVMMRERDASRPADRIRAHDQPRACDLRGIRPAHAGAGGPRQRSVRTDLPARLPGNRREDRRPAADASIPCISSRWASPRNGLPGRDASMPIRVAEAQAVRRIIEDRFGKDHAANKNWVICGDFNDYRQRIIISGDAYAGYGFEVADEAQSSLNVLLAGGFLRKPRRAARRAGPLDALSHARPAGAAPVPARLHSGCQRRWRGGMQAPCPTSSATGSHGAPSSRRDRRWSAIRAPAGTGPRPPIIVRWR